MPQTEKLSNEERFRRSQKAERARRDAFRKRIDGILGVPGKAPEELSPEERLRRFQEAERKRRAGYEKQIAAVVATLKKGRKKLAKLDKAVDAELDVLPAHRCYGRGAWLRKASSQINIIHDNLEKTVEEVEDAGRILTG